MGRKNTKRQMVLDHLKNYGTITSLDAIKLYGATRLAAIIYNLRNDGFDIDTEKECGVDRYGNSTNYARYIYNGCTYTTA